MTNVHFEGRRLTVGSRVIELSMDILDAFELDGRVIVLGDPDSYLLDPQYRDRQDRVGGVRQVAFVMSPIELARWAELVRVHAGALVAEGLAASQPPL